MALNLNEKYFNEKTVESDLNSESTVILLKRTHHLTNISTANS